jgi:hypothetical protein
MSSGSKSRLLRVNINFIIAWLSVRGVMTFYDKSKSEQILYEKCHYFEIRNL